MRVYTKKEAFEQQHSPESESIENAEDVIVWLVDSVFFFESQIFALESISIVVQFKTKLFCYDALEQDRVRLYFNGVF